MSTEIQSIVNAVRQLNLDQRHQLAEALELIDSVNASARNPAELVHAMRGKYKHLQTSSEDFIQRKAAETPWESRP